MQQNKKSAAYTSAVVMSRAFTVLYEIKFISVLSVLSVPSVLC